MINENFMVSVSCTTYNQDKFITQTIESFLMQQTNFPFEIVVGDDCSTDGTSAILQSFKQQYPDKIKVISANKNGGAHQNTINTLHACTGKYIALCDGDDYWTNPLKLQKQVDFLEQNPEYVICCHYTCVVDTDGNTLYVAPKPVPLIHTYHDLLTGKQVETKTATVVYRNINKISLLFQQPWYFNCFAADKLFKIFSTSVTGGKIYVMPEVMSCYRNHVGGIWSMIKTEARMEMVISDFNLIIKHFSYSGIQRVKLLLLYINRYLLFELKRHRFQKIYNTVKLLV
ncbi:glycosyltransferase [Mucilaginibacter sp. FT3.2]|uniref:glycosyltransferase n=1 Tax=Mucilaginibacter sp. FT3.2 TaxID=2723090 RepID=UPI0016224C9E|nr:glycosyltransferase family 2 protein [Mucilaginibacter sp. FT3.2]MBB6234296.1 glycosyltransferase involved in cell wall biosynthesis [Mucilaginibacter sp. FT3.2]